MLCLHLCCNCSLQIHELEDLSSGDQLKDEHWEGMAVLRDWVSRSSTITRKCNYWRADAYRGSSWWVLGFIDNEKCRGRCPSSQFPSRDDVFCRIPQTAGERQSSPTPRPNFHIGPRERSDSPSASTASLSRPRRSLPSPPVLPHVPLNYEIPCQAVASDPRYRTTWRIPRRGRAGQSL